MQTRSRWATFAIISATVAIVFAPVFIPREVARWYLAAAANAYRLGDMATAAENMERAVAWDDDIAQDGLVMSVLLAEQFDFQNAIRAFKLTLGGKPPQSAIGLNQLAYYRALAGIELNAALSDIDRAIDLAGSSPAMLDTKAWVLHALGRDLEALSFINEAVGTFEAQLGILKESEGSRIDEASAAETDSESQGDELREPPSETVQNKSLDPTSMWPELTDVRDRIDATKQKLSPAIFSLAVMRFHRMRIYEAVGASPEARLDRDWLRQHDVPIVDQLF